jgi:tricarballylate dehydrogenase
MAGSSGQDVYDLVVVGCGVAGLSAAAAAAEAGARVAVLERAPREERGGQSRWTEAYLRMKSHTEVTDDFEAMLAENGSPPLPRPRPGAGGSARA